MYIEKISSEMSENIKSVHGEDGITWLSELSQNLREVENNWDIKIVKPFGNLTYSYVAMVETTDGQAVLKYTPTCKRTEQEIAWYIHGPSAAPIMLKSDSERGLLLLERLLPEGSAKDLVKLGKDDEATEAIASVVVELGSSRSTSDFSFLHISEFHKNLSSLTGYLDEEALDKALNMLKDLTLDKSKDCVLHGDLHHDNVLSSGDSWKAIDPHGYIGPRAFEVGAMIRNPHDCFPKTISLKAILTRRIDIMANNLPYSKKEIQAWSLIYTLVAASWSLTDHGEIPREHVEIAKAISNMKWTM